MMPLCQRPSVYTDAITSSGDGPADLRIESLLLSPRDTHSRRWPEQGNVDKLGDEADLELAPRLLGDALDGRAEADVS